MDIEKYVHRYDGSATSTTRSSLIDTYHFKMQPCAFPDCRTRVASHWPPNDRTAQWWVFCDWHYKRLPPNTAIRLAQEIQ